MLVDGWTLALQALNFLILAWVLQRFLYRPVTAAIGRRRAQIEKAVAEARDREAKAEAALKDYQARGAAIAAERASVMQAAEAEIATQRSEALERARAEAEKLVEAGRKQIEAAKAAAEEAVEEEAVGLALEVADKLLRIASGTASTATFLDEVWRRLEALPAEEIERLRADLASGGMVSVAAAPALDDAAQANVRARLKAILHLEPRVDFRHDPSLNAGVELRFPHHLIGFSWRECLDAVRRDLRAK